MKAFASKIAARPRATIIALHPHPASRAAMCHISSSDAGAEKGGYVVAYPDGLKVVGARLGEAAPMELSFWPSPAACGPN